MVLLCPALFVARTWAGGFQVDEHSARGTGMGGALVASTGDPTSLSLNPAAISFIEGVHLSLGTTVLLPDYRFSGVAPSTSTSKMLSQVLFPPNVNLTYGSRSGFALGVSVTLPYLSSTSWSQDWVGGRIATASEYRSVFISPGVAVRVSSTLAVGLGVNIVSTHFLLSQRVGLDTSMVDGLATYLGDAKYSYGVQAGVLFRPEANWSFGASYRSKVSADLDGGSVTFADIPAALAAQYPDGQVSMNITTPDEFHFGIGWRPTRAVYLEGNVEYALWSSFESLQLKFASSALRDTMIPEHWNNTVTFRFGVELNVSDVTLRGGFMVDETPVPDQYLRPSLPDADKVGYSVGVGYKIGEGLRMDAAYMYMKFSDRTISNSLVEYSPGQAFNGIYRGFVSVVGLNVTYSWN